MSTKIKILSGIALLLTLLLIIGVGVAEAQSFRTGDSVTVAKGQRVDGSLWVSGKNIDIAGTVDGDMFCVGQNVTVSGTINGDVICAAQTIRVSGKVNGDTRLAGQLVSINGNVSNNVSIASQTFSLERDGRIGADASVAANDVTFSGPIERDVAVAAQSVSFSSSVGREAKATAENITLVPGAKINGDFSYTSDNTVNVGTAASVGGAVVRYEPKQTSNYQNNMMPGFSILTGFYVVISMLIIALALVLLVPGLLHSVSSIAINEPLKTLLVGAVAGFVFPVLVVSFMLTLVGIPLALLLLLSWLLVLSLSGVFFSYYVGRQVLKNQRSPIVIMLAGALLVLVLYLIPIIGFITMVLAAWMGSGMTLLSLKRRFPRPNYALPLASTRKSSGGK